MNEDEKIVSLPFRKTPRILSQNMTLDSIIADHISLVVRMHQWNLVRAAKALKISRMTLYRYLHKYKIVRHERLEHNKRHNLYYNNQNVKRLSTVGKTSRT